MLQGGTVLDRVPTLSLSTFTHGSPLERETFVTVLGEALKTFGFVTLADHNIDPALIRKTYQMIEDLFALDVPTKERYTMAQGGERGYTGFGKEHAKDSQYPDLKEFWHVGPELPPGHPYESLYPKNFWPAELPEFKTVTLSLYRSLIETAEIMLRAIALYLKLPENQLSDMIKDGNSILRAIHYPALGPDAHPKAVRAAAHEDINLITLLCEATQSGLELLTHDGTWLPIEALEGQIVVDAGDMLKRITNHVIPATTHRVVNPPDGKNVPRYSLPFFVHPYPTCMLECLPTCQSPDNPPKYPPITADDFLKQRLREIGLIK